MKNNKNGFTIVELISVVALLLIIVGLFSINFIKNLDNTKINEYEDTISKIESAADAYVMTYKESNDSSFEDVKLVVLSEESFCYIPVEEIVDKGFLNSEVTNPSTGENLNGFVKFTKEKSGNYKFEYVEEEPSYITVIYEKNGANAVSRYAQAFICDSYTTNDDIIACAEGISLPSIIRSGGDVYGWSTNNNDKTSTFVGGSLLSELLRNSSFSVENNKITLYAVSSAKRKASLIIDDTTTNEVSCDIYNTETSCDVTLPNFTAPEYYYAKGWNTNKDATGRLYDINSNLTLTNNLTLYSQIALQEFDVYVNKLNRVSSTTVTPSNINIVLVLDISGSMSTNSRLTNLKMVCNGLVERMNLGNSTVSLISFESSANTLLRFSTDKNTITKTIEGLSSTGGTNFGTAISTANTLMNSVPNDKPTYVIFVSDGNSSIGSTNTSLVELKNKTKIYAMGIGASVNNAALQAIATDESTFYNYNDSADDMTLSQFYDLFDDIVQDIIIVNGDGPENAIANRVIDGQVSLGSLVISEKYPFDVYLNEELVTSFQEVNDYLYKKDEIYYFDILKFSLDKTEIGLENMRNIRLKYFYTEDTSEVIE